MLEIKVLVKVHEGFKYLGEVEDLLRFDTFKSYDETIDDNVIIKKIKEKYINTPIEFIRIESIKKVDSIYFANMGEL